MCFTKWISDLAKCAWNNFLGQWALTVLFWLQERVLREAVSIEARLRIAAKGKSFLTLDEMCEKPGGLAGDCKGGYPAIPRTHPQYPNVSDAMEMKYEVGNQ